MRLDFWERFGFGQNPYDTSPLSANPGALLSVAGKAMVGRDEASAEGHQLGRFLSTRGGGRMVVEGAIGVGKTTFVNYHRWRREHLAQEPLFSPATEIRIEWDWGTRDLLLAILVGVAQKVRQSFGQEWLERSPFEEIAALGQVVIKRGPRLTGAQAFGAGLNWDSTNQVSVATKVPAQTLQGYLEQVLETLPKLRREKPYQGMIVAINNLELAAYRHPQELRRLLDESRDLFQTRNVHFILVGRGGFYNDYINALPRLRTVFSAATVEVPPLTREQVLDAVHRRYKIFALGKGPVPPVPDEFISDMHTLFRGSFRAVLQAAESVAMELPETICQVDASQARKIISKTRRSKIQASITAAEFKLLCNAAKDETFTNAEISRKTGLRPPNVSAMLTRLMDTGYIQIHDKQGKRVLYTVTDEARVLNLP